MTSLPTCSTRRVAGSSPTVSGTAAKYGEPFISLFRRDEIEQLLVEHGFDSIGHFGAPEAAVRYFGGNDLGVPDVQRLVTAVLVG